MTVKDVILDRWRGQGSPPTMDSVLFRDLKKATAAKVRAQLGITTRRQGKYWVWVFPAEVVAHDDQGEDAARPLPEDETDYPDSPDPDDGSDSPTIGDGEPEVEGLDPFWRVPREGANFGIPVPAWLRQPDPDAPPPVARKFIRTRSATDDYNRLRRPNYGS